MKNEQVIVESPDARVLIAISQLGARIDHIESTLVTITSILGMLVAQEAKKPIENR